MKKVKKIYGVYGMMEYQAIIPVGKAHLRVSFTEGSATAIGTTPAKYVTDNLMFQHAIEHSGDFKNGRIKLIRTIPLDEDVEIAGVEQSEETTETTEQSVESAETTTEEQSVELETKEFTCNDDAKDYLEETYGVKRSAMRSRDAIIAQGKEHGVAIVFTE